MTRIETFASEIREYCSAHADAKLATRWQRYFTEGYDAWGLLDKQDPIWNEQQQAWFDRYRAIGLRGFLRLGEALFSSGKYEEGALAIHFAKRWVEEFDAKAVDQLARWFAAGIGNWAHTDVLCALVITPVLRGGRVPLEALTAWRASTFKYQRRAVPVAVVGLLSRDADVAPLLDFLRPLMTDPEKVVQQGMGWFLRDAWKLHPKPVESFLREWKDQAPSLILRTASEKMAPEARARFRRGRSC